MILDLLSGDIYEVEVSFYAAANLLGTVLDHQQESRFIGPFVEYITSSLLAKENLTLAKTIVEFIKSASTVLAQFPDHAQAIISFLIGVFLKHEQL